MAVDTPRDHSGTAIPAAETGSRAASRCRQHGPGCRSAGLNTAVDAATPSGFDIDFNVLNGQNLVSVLTNRAAATFAQQRTPMRADGRPSSAWRRSRPPPSPTRSSSINTSTACALGDAVIRGNRMNDLTFGTLLVAGIASLRIQDNNLTGGVAGFWVVLPDARNPQDVRRARRRFFDTIENFEEFNLLTDVRDPAPAAGD